MCLDDSYIKPNVTEFYSCLHFLGNETLVKKNFILK